MSSLWAPGSSVFEIWVVLENLGCVTVCRGGPSPCPTSLPFGLFCRAKPSCAAVIWAVFKSVPQSLQYPWSMEGGLQLYCVGLNQRGRCPSSPGSPSCIHPRMEGDH